MNINTEDKEILLQKLRDYNSESLRSHECNDDIGVMVYPVVREKYMGSQFPIKTVIEEIRTDSNYLKGKPKSELPAIFFSVAGFNGNKVLQNVSEHTGLIVVDIDKKDNSSTDFNQLRNDFSRNKYVFACLRSPSGGLKAVYNTNLKDINHHKAYFHSLVEHITKRYPEISKIDTSGSNVNRACYMPYDKEVYFNPYSYRYCLSDPQITEIRKEIESKKLYQSSLKPILEVEDYSFEDHYNNIRNLLINRTSVGLRYRENRTSVGLEDTTSNSNSSSKKRTSVGLEDSTSNSNSSSKKRTSVGLYDSIFNKYRLSNIERYIMSTDVPFFELALWRHSYPYKLDYETFLDEYYFRNNTQELLSTDDALGFEETDGIDFCEVKNLEDGIPVGFRHKSLASMSMKFMFNNPFCHPKRLVEQMQHLNHKHCLDPAPETNPKPSDEEVKNIVIYNYQKFISGELDFNKALRKNHKNTGIMRKYVFRSRKNVKNGNADKQQEGYQEFQKGRRNKHVRRYGEAVSSLMNGYKITKKSIAEEMGITERHLRRIRSDEEHQEFFELQDELIKEYNASLKKKDADYNGLDLAKAIPKNTENFLKNDPECTMEEDFSLNDDQKEHIFNRVYLKILPSLTQDQIIQLETLFQLEILSFESHEKQLLLKDVTEVSEKDFWTHFALENQLLDLANKV